jgi:hypothetical protein
VLALLAFTCCEADHKPLNQQYWSLEPYTNRNLCYAIAIQLSIDMACLASDQSKIEMPCIL